MQKVLDDYEISFKAKAKLAAESERIAKLAAAKFQTTTN